MSPKETSIEQASPLSMLTRTPALTRLIGKLQNLRGLQPDKD